MPRPSAALAEQIGTLYAHINAATYELLLLIAEFDRTHCYIDLNAKSTAAWLNYACGIAPGAAREKVRVARALIALPETSRAFREGRLSYSKARAITRIADADSESHFLNVAAHSTAAQTERIVRDFRRVVARDGNAREMFLERSCEVYWGDRGELVIRARLSPDQGALFLKTGSTTRG